MCKSVKSYVEEGVRYKFDRDKFSEMIDKKRLEKMSSSKKVYRCNIMTELADQLSVSFDSVKSWTYGNNGPVDVEKVKEIADYFAVDYHELMSKEENQMNLRTNDNNEKISEQQRLQTRAAVREVYVALVEALDKVWEYYDVESRDLICRYSEDELIEKEITTYEIAEEAGNRVRKLMAKHFLDIPELLSEKIRIWLFRNIECELMDVSCVYRVVMDNTDPMELEEIEEGKKEIKRDAALYRSGEYYEELKNLFSEYVLSI